MTDHKQCEELRAKLDEDFGSYRKAYKELNLNFVKAMATVDVVTKAGANAAKRADSIIQKHEDYLAQARKVIEFLLQRINDKDLTEAVIKNNANIFTVVSSSPK